MMPDFSILICSLESRSDRLVKLVDFLHSSKYSGGTIEVLTEIDDGTVAVSDKRNKLLLRAQGRYIAFVDDDDHVSGDYASKILEAICSGPDCVGIEGTVPIDGKEYLFSHSIDYAGWYSSGSVYYRTPNHLNPVKLDIARSVRFKAGMRFGEDADYSRRLRPRLRSEVFIHGPIYFYNPSRSLHSGGEQ